MGKKNKIVFDVSAVQELVEKFESLNGDLKATTTEALQKSKAKVTFNLLSATEKKNYPAKGKYSTGKTRKSIDTSKTVTWEGTRGTISAGFDFEKGGMASIYLMYGTPRMKPVKKIYNAIYGTKTRKEITEIQKDVFAKAIKKKMEG